MPAKLVFIPNRPYKSQKAGPGGDQISKAPAGHLARCWDAAVEVDDAQTFQHHPRGRATENRKEREILSVKKGKCGSSHNHVRSIPAYMATQNRKECEHSAVAE